MKMFLKGKRGSDELYQRVPFVAPRKVLLVCKHCKQDSFRLTVQTLVGLAGWPHQSTTRLRSNSP